MFFVRVYMVLSMLLFLVLTLHKFFDGILHFLCHQKKFFQSKYSIKCQFMMNSVTISLWYCYYFSRHVTQSQFSYLFCKTSQMIFLLIEIKKECFATSLPTMLIEVDLVRYVHCSVPQVYTVIFEVVEDFRHERPSCIPLLF